MAVAFDAVGPSSAGVESGTSPLTWTHTLVSGASTVVLAWVTLDAATDTGYTLSCTCGGVAMTPVATLHGNGLANGFGTLFQLTAVTSGAKTITATAGGTGTGLDVMAGGSLSFTGVNQSTPVGTPATAVGSGLTTAVSASLASNTNGNIIAGFVTCGAPVSTTTAPSTSRFISPGPGSEAGGSGNSAGATSPATGSSVTMAWVLSGADQWGALLVEVLPLFSSGGQVEAMQQQLSRLAVRRRKMSQWPVFNAESPNANINPGTVAAATTVQPPTMISPFTGITQLAGSGVSAYFADQYGNPRLLWLEQAWALPWNAGRWNGGNWQSDIDAYFTARSAQGYTAWVGVAWSCDHLDSTCLSGGRTWDGIYPFLLNGTPGKITTGSETITLNNAFWVRTDYLINAAANHGMAVILNLGLQYDFTGAANVFFNLSSTQANAFGQLIAARYPKAQYPQLSWFFGDDATGGQDALFTQMLNGMITAGDTRTLISTEQSPETSCHIEFDTGAVYVPGGFGMTSATYNWVYTYDPTYLGIEKAYTESGTTLLPVVYGDGIWYGDNSSTQNIADYTIRRVTWWALASGARGVNNTSGPTVGGDVWQWYANAVTDLTTDSNGTWITSRVPGVITYFTGLADWHKLIPDTGNVLITAGRGTKSTNDAPGFNTPKYGDTDNYVAGSVTPAGTLAVIYSGQAFSITIDQSKMAAGYTATWVDPVTCATSAATAGSTYNSGTAKGNNSAGNPDWVLVLQGTPASPPELAMATRIAP